MGIDSAQRNVQLQQQAIARLQEQKSREASRCASEQKRASSAAEAATRASSDSTRRSKLRDAQRHHDSAIQCQRRVADIERQILSAQKKLNGANKKLLDEQEKARREVARQQERSAREQQGSVRAIASRLSEHERVHDVILSEMEKLHRLPDRIVVLFLAANPRDQKQLFLDEEVRAIGEMIRKAEHRDAVRLESRWAMRALDLLQAINECKPRIVHFSGHGSKQDELAFQDDQGRTKLVSKAAIVQTMAADAGDIQLVFFNTCYSRAQAESVVQHVPAAIGMTTTIGDTAARVFAAQFYSSIGFGLSVATAFAQAKSALMLEGIPEEDTPELFVGPSVDPAELVLVRPP